MKRTTKLLAILLIISVLTGCRNTATVPEGYPDYTFNETPTTEQLRDTAVRAMRDLLSIQWTPAETISYYNTAGRDKQFDYTPGTTYGGLLYSGASTGLFHFLEFYDQESGVLTYPGSGDELRRSIGSGCADSLLWSWATVSNSFNCGYYPSMMVYKNGFLPVGDYTYNFELTSYYNFPTQAIIKNNGEDVIYDSYTKVLPADALISSSIDHAMMVIENPTVIRLEDGSIDTENSYIMLQDQRGGTREGFMEEKVDGRTIHYNSERNMKMTFAELLSQNYIPVTIAEFTGEKAYEKAEVTLEPKKCRKLPAAQEAVITSNYPIAVIKLITTDNDGIVSVYDRILMPSSSANGPSKTYDLNDWDALQTIDTDAYKRIKIEVVVSTGEHFRVIDLSV